MAKSARTPGGKRDTHYSRKERTVSTGRTAGKRDGGGERPARGESGEGDEKPTASKAAGERKPYNSGGENRPFARKRNEGSSDRPKSFGDKKPFRKDGDQPYERKSFGDKKPFGQENNRPSFRKDGDQPYERKSLGDKKPFRKDGDKPYERKAGGDRDTRGGERPYKKSTRSDGGKAPFSREDGDKKPYQQRGDKPPFSRKPDEGADRPAKRPYTRREDAPQGGDERPKRPYARKNDGDGERKQRFGDRKEGGDKPYSRRTPGDNTPFERKGGKRDFGKKRTTFDGNEFVENTNPDRPGRWDTDAKTGPMTLNKYLAHSGISSRRDAAIMIKEGKVEVNGKVLTEPGYRVLPADVVTMDGKKMMPQRSFVYVLLNKPKDFLTTTEDDRGRRTVMELVAGATEDRLYPIGRLDRNTTGVLLLTNDGDLAQRLSHPKFESKKIYQVTLNKDVTKRDFDQIVAGVELEDGPARVDRLAYLESKNEIGLEIHSGRNRIVRRIFESLGYDVEKLDRVMYAGLTKKNVTRGKWRFLSEKEVIQLKHFRS